VQSSRPEPRGGSLGVAQGGGLPGPGRERKAGNSFGGLPIAERHQDGEAVQPPPMQVSEGGRQQRIVVLCSRRFQDGRRTPPW
jgi:hypothetical protein